jgi:branched-chain amino acid transport system substrate-binding protein
MKKKISSFVMLLSAFCLLLSCNPSKEDDTVKIGAILGLSGNGSAPGQYTLNGIQIAIDEQNEKGGLLGKKIILDVQDSKGEPKEALILAKNLLASKEVPKLVYANTSGVCLSIQPELEKKEILFFAGATSDKILANSKFTFRNYADAKTLSHKILNFVRDSLRLNNIGFLYANTEYGQSVQKDIVNNTQGIKTSFSEPFEEKEMEYKSLITSKLNNSIPIVYVVGTGKALGTMIKQVRESGYKGQIICDPLVNNPDAINTAGENIKGLIYLDFAFEPTNMDSKTQKFCKLHEKKTGKKPIDATAIAYEGMKTYFSVVEEVKSFDTGKIIKEMNKYQNDNGLFGPTRVINFNFVHSTFFKRF